MQCFCQTGLPENGASYSELQESKALLHKAVPRAILQGPECLDSGGAHTVLCHVGKIAQATFGSLTSAIWSFV